MLQMTNLMSNSYSVVMADGAKYAVIYGAPLGPPNGGTASAGGDYTGTGIWVNRDIYLPNGTHLLMDSAREIDANGGALYFAANSVTDTVGRTVSVNASDATTSSPASLSFQYPDSSGAQRSVTILFRTIAFTCGGTNDQYSVPSAVVLPNGLTYTFQYDSCGVVNKITYPSGGYTRYDIQNFNEKFPRGEVPDTLAVSQVTAKYVCSAPAVTLGATTASSGDTCSVPEAVTTYAPTLNTYYSDTGYNGNSKNVVVDANGNQTIYFFSFPELVGNWPVEIKREIYQGTSTPPLRTIETDYYWNYSVANQTVIPTLPRIQTTTLDNGKKSKVEWDYYFQHPAGGPSPLKEKREYDYDSSTWTRKTTYTWLHLDNPTTYNTAYRQPQTMVNILDRKTSETVYDASGQFAKTTYEYDVYTAGLSQTGSGYSAAFTARGNVAAVKRWRNTDNAWLETRYQYDDAGNVVSMKDPNGNVTQFSYDDNYQDGVNRDSYAFLTKITYPTVNGSAQIERKQYYWGSGLLAASCGRNFGGSSCTAGLASAADYATYTYDALGRAIFIGAGDGGQKSIVYEESGSYPLSAETTSTIASGVNKVTTVVLDGLGRVSQTQLNSDPNCYSGVKVDKTYDGEGHVSTVSNPYCSIGESTSGSTSYTYDALGRTLRVTHPDTSYAENQYTGPAVLSTDEGNGTTKVQRVSQTDALGRLVKVCEVSSTTQEGANSAPSACGLDIIGKTGFLTTYGYDVLGNLTSVAQGGVSRSFVYDSLSRLKTATNPESGTTGYVYDLNGNLTSKTDARGITTTYGYDVLNRLTGKSYNDGSTPSACFQYDQGSTKGLGRLTNEWTQAGTCSSTPPSNAITKRSLAEYDNMGRVKTDKQCSPPNDCSTSSYNSTYAYDLAGDLIQSTNGLSGSSALSFWSQYDSAGRLCWVGDQQSTSCQARGLFAARKYSPAGGLVDANLGANLSNISLHREYNNRLWPVSETDTGVTDGTATVKITGAEQYAGPSSSGTLTFSGTGYTTINQTTQYDSGAYLFYLEPSSPPTGLGWGQGDTPSTLAAKLVANMSKCGTLGYMGQPIVLKGVANGPVVTLTRCDGTNTPFSFSTSLAGRDTSFPAPSFSFTTYGPTSTAPIYATITFSGTEQSRITGGTSVQDAGTYQFFLQPNSPPVTVGYGQGDTPSTLAAKLVASMQTCGQTALDGQPILLKGVANGAAVTLTPCDGSGAAYPFSYNLAQSNYTPPGFSVTASGSALSTPPDGIYDQGEVYLNVNGLGVAHAYFNQGSTPQSIVSAIISSSAGNGRVTLQGVSGDTSSFTIRAIDPGASDYYLEFRREPIPVPFTEPSFQASPASGPLNDAQPTVLYSWSIPANGGYAPNGDILSGTDSVIGSWTYAYDDMNRLTNASATSGQVSGLNIGWTYDRYGNRWDQNGSGTGNGTLVQPHYTFTGNNNRIDGPGSNCDPLHPQPFCYDAAGSLLNDGIHTYAYDAENRIIKVDGQQTYVYDAEGRRVAKYGAGGTIIASYILGLGGEQVTELNGSGQWVHTNVFAGGKLLATYTGPAGTGAAGYHYQLTDWLGTKRLQASANGAQEQTCFSYPFGDGLSCTGSGDATEHHFTGKERDSETGLDYFGARYYASNMGRWMSPDALNLTDERVVNPANTINKYVYGGNNPLKYTDPDGRDITIFYTSTGPAGHMWMGAVNEQNGQYAILNFGPMETGNFIADLDTKLNIIALRDVPGDVNFGRHIGTVDDFKRDYTSLTIQTNPEDTQKAIDEIRKFNKVGHEYYLLGPNCSTVCKDVLNKILGLGHESLSGVRPASIWNQLFDRWSSYAGFRPGWATDPPTGIDVGNSRYPMNTFDYYWNLASPPPEHACVTYSDNHGNSGGGCD